MRIEKEESESTLDLELILTGRTLRVYWFLLKMKKPVGRTDVQRGVKLSSVSLVEYHLKKLVRSGLVEQNSFGDYYIEKIVRVGVTRFYSRFRDSFIPRFALYLTFYFVILVLASFLLRNLSIEIAFLIYSIVIFGILTSTFELINLLRATPS